MKMQSCFLYVLLVFNICSSCNTKDAYTPKPRGYFNISFPEKTYRLYDNSCPFTFSYPAYSQILLDSGASESNCWNNLIFSQFNARLHLTYYGISSRKAYEGLVEDARTLAFKHTVKASSIDQKLINYPGKKVYGIYYAIEGNTASSVQFFLTDSAKHYFRGALYFNERPQYDSIAPVIKFIKKDVDVMISSFKWKN